MPFARRPDSWLILSGPIPVRAEPPPGTAGVDDSLSEFSREAPAQITAAEKPQQVVLVPAASVTPRPARTDAATTPIQNVSIDRTSSIQQAAPRAPERARLDVRIDPSWLRRVGTLGRLATNTPRRAFAFGAVGGVLAMWIAGAPTPSTVVPIASHTFVSQAVSPIPELPALRANERVTVEEARPVGTNGRQTAQPVSSGGATRRNASRGSYRGSLALRSAPQGARVFVNGTFVGSTPLVLDNLPVGSRAVRFEADGYQRWSTAARVIADRQTGVSATLAPARP